MIRNTIIFLAVLILNLSAALAQKVDSSALKSPEILPVITAKQIDELSKQAIHCEIDTGTLSNHFYNPLFKESFSPQFLGNTGSAFQNNIFSLRNIQSPFVFANPYLPYFHSPFTRKHYNTHRPFTEASYVTAGNKETSEQLLSVIHTQNFNQYLNLGLQYDLISSKGIYLLQEIKSNRFSFFGSYDKDNYSIYSNISRNKIKSFENGGLIDPSYFLVHQAKDPIAYGMNLLSANSSVQNLSFFATQSYRFTKTVIDTSFIPADTSEMKLLADTSVIRKQKALPFMVNHTIRYDRYSKVYKDEILGTDSIGFYNNNYYKTNTAMDSAFMHILENSFQISGDEYKFLPGFIMGIKHQFVGYSYLYPRPDTVTSGSVLMDTVYARDFSSSYNNLSVYAMLLFNKKSRITYQGKMEYFFAGYRQNDVLADFTLKYKLNSKGAMISAFGKFYVTEADFFLKHYASSHFQWNAVFPKSTTTSAFLSYRSGDGTLYAEGGLTLLGNYIYMNTFAIPFEANLPITVSSFRLEKSFKWGGFNHIHKLVAQQVNHEEFLQLPLLAYGNTSYYENAFFKGVLKFQIGFDFYINTSYYADAWMPATGMFHRQDIAKIGQYPYLDGFLNWKIKRTRFFLKYVNALAGLAGYNYFTTYGYPMNPGSLKFGLSWTFYD